MSTIGAPALALALALLLATGCGVFSSSPPLAKQEPPQKPAVQVSAQSDAAAPPAEAPPPVSSTPAPRGEALSVGPAPPRESRESGSIVRAPQAKPLIAQSTAGAPPAGAAPAPAPVPPGPKRFVIFNFDNADLEAVVHAASEIVGFNYVVAPGARGKKVTVQTTARIASDDVFAVLLTILDVNGLAAVRSGTLYRIIPREGAPDNRLDLQKRSGAQAGAARVAAGSTAAGATPAQEAALAAMNTALTPKIQTVTDARNALTAATFLEPRDDAAIRSAIERVSDAHGARLSPHMPRLGPGPKLAILCTPARPRGLVASPPRSAASE